ncbi:MAG: aminoacyl-tRNA deacylase [bacterium]
MTMARSLQAHLNRTGVMYDLLHHPHSRSSLETARLAHVPVSQVAKGILVKDGERYLLCVIPAGHRLMLKWLDGHLNGHFELVSEAELPEFFDDCETGAIPALGQVYGLPVIWHESLCDMDDVYIEGGDHENLIHVDHGAFMELMGRQRHMVISCPDSDYGDYLRH